MSPRAAATAILLALAAAILAPRSALAQRALGPFLPDDAPARAAGALLPGAAAPAGADLLAPAGPYNPLAILAGAGEAIPGTLAGNAGFPSAATSPPAPGAAPARGGLSTTLNILVVLTLVSLGPSLMLMTTCFMRILVVLGLLKQAMGTTTVPPPQAVTALALFMTLVVMAPTLERINAEAIAPYRAGQVASYDELWTRAKQPLRDFMFAQIDASGNWTSVYTVLERRGVDVSQPERLTRADVDMTTLVPAFMLSELKVAFLMGFKIYLPFLVIDMVISTMLISMSMMMLPPVLVSLPFKLLLFVLVDGWALIAGGLMASFALPTPEAISLAPHALDLVVALRAAPPTLPFA